MGLARILRGIAESARPRVFCVAGSDARDEARSLRALEGLQLTTTPRAANILLIVGNLDPGLVAPTLVAHDALARPRATVWWQLGSTEDLRVTFPGLTAVEAPLPALTRIHKELVSGARESEPALLPDVEPASWRGVGPYGQGGKAMTAGVPYGRPMAERADDRDGLKLDYLPVRIGPLFQPFPPGLALDVNLQGDVIQEASLENFAAPPATGRSIFDAALREAVAIRDLELARARSHLQWLADAVYVAGPASLSIRILDLAGRIAPGDSDVIAELERTLRRRGFIGWNTRGIGVIRQRALAGIMGPVARASGAVVDARVEDASYRELGFEPVTQDEGDARARWLQRLRETAQALELAERADDAVAGGSDLVESPRGALTADAGPSAHVAKHVPSLIEGMEWGDAVTTLVSLDLDMSEAARSAPVTAAS